MGTVSAWLDRVAYPTYPDCWDDVLLRTVILKHVEPGDRLLDLGAGVGYVHQMNFRNVAQVSGCDLNAAVISNPFLDEAKVCSADSLDWPDDTFDVVISNKVLEHLQDPLAVFREVRRVLKPSGYFIFSTPNRFHYVPLIATMTPFWFHRWINRKRGRAEEHTFPTFYRANTSSTIVKLAKESHLSVVDVFSLEGRPEYLRHWLPTYLIGLLYERIVNCTELLAGMRVILLGVLRRTG